jgi:cytochrome b6-f complex iron-sulfur subunit
MLTNRRFFLTRLIDLAKVGLLGIFLYPPLSFVVSRIPRLPVKVRVRATPEKDLLLVEDDFFLFPAPDGPTSMSRICTHLGCRVNYSEKDDLLVCPCHGSRYATNGKVLRGPALKDLPELPVSYSSKDGYIVTVEDAT